MASRGAPFPAYRAQLATLVDEPPGGEAWVHEVKYDGYRIGCALERGRATLWSRRGQDWTAAFAPIAAAAAALPVRSALLDGEVAVVLPDGRTSFQALQNRSTWAGSLLYFVFDLLYLDGEAQGGLPLLERKARLAALLAGATGTIRYAPHVEGSGADVLREACRLGLEGIVSKRADAPYRPGRGGEWTKAKCLLRQELVIGGFTLPAGRREGIGAPLAGYHEGGALRFAGKVGTGFSNAGARALRARLEPLRRATPPFEPPPRAARRSRATSGAASRVLVRGVPVSHPDRLVFPDDGLTKLDLVRYYDAVAPAMVPHLAGRPLTLFHCPSGIGGECRFLKHSKVWAPPAVRRVRIPEKTKLGEYLVADTPEALVSLAQLGVVELHTWNATTGALETPDRLVVDLDPGPRVTWRAVVEAARLVREALRAAGLACFVKTTGGRGLHVVVPLVPRARWEACLAFARALAVALAGHDPGRFTATFAKRGREDLILVDYLRNNRTNTSACAFTARARTGAPVSVPIAWDELSPRLDPGRFTARTVPSRLVRLGADPWTGYAAAARPLGAAGAVAGTALAGHPEAP